MDLMAAAGAAGTSNRIRYYSAVVMPATAHVYYRVKQVNADGSFIYSNTAEITVSCPAATGPTDILTVFGNPVASGAGVSFHLFSSIARGLVYIVFYDAIGRQYLSSPIFVNRENNIFYFRPPQLLAKGTYFVCLVSADLRWRSNTVKLVLIK